MGAGRKRSFDKQEALEKAMRVFWENGYAGTSLTDLTAALGINKPSLYAAFGNKEELFGASIRHYMSRYGIQTLASFSDSPELSFEHRLRSYLYALINIHTNGETPKGCFVVNCRCESGSVAFPSEISAILQDMGVAGEGQLATILEAELNRGELAVGSSVTAMSSYLQSVVYGLAIQARGGKTKKELRAVADIAVRSFIQASILDTQD